MSARLRHELEKIRVEAAVPEEWELLAGWPTAPGSAANLPSRKFVAGGHFLPVDFVNSLLPASVESVLVASRPESVLAAPLFASTAPFFPGRSLATRVPPRSDQAPFLSLVVSWYSLATLTLGPLLAIDLLLC